MGSMDRGLCGPRQMDVQSIRRCGSLWKRTSDPFRVWKLGFTKSPGELALVVWPRFWGARCHATRPSFGAVPRISIRQIVQRLQRYGRRNATTPVRLAEARDREHPKPCSNPGLRDNRIHGHQLGSEWFDGYVASTESVRPGIVTHSAAGRVAGWTVQA